MNSTSHPARQEVLGFRPTSVASRGEEWRGAAREGNKANLSPNLCLRSLSMLAASPDSPTSRLRPREGGEGEGGAWQEGLWAGPGRERASSRPSLLISPSISHTYIYFFLKFPSLPQQRTSIIGLPHMRTECRRWVCIFRPFAKKLPEFSVPPTIVSPPPSPPPKESHLYIMLYYFSRLARRGREKK